MAEEILCKKEQSLKNKAIMEFSAISSNEQLARIAVAAFITPLNPTLEEMSDVKTAVSEAVTNAIIHGYNGCAKLEDKVRLTMLIRDDVLEIEIQDWGIGIENIEKAMEPLYTTKPELERSGMGFAFMEAFMDDLHVESKVYSGTLVWMCKKLGTSAWLA